MSDEETMVERVGERLRKECLEVFGSTWSNDVAWRFARAAIESLRKPTEAMVNETGGGECNKWARGAWALMIDAALKEQEKAG
ncbi:hypothetical protein ELG76_04260 [Rhizobium leguminosarum]|uniref:hypothetical protein n=1 Tax=Rhizobium leguminosarum TaxID=384 RepID=UPI00102F7CAD|nr:hypothetical protein [Rhizobium leguminosarum]TBG78634.1 hypothetical protein ELG76_04260 [Rhizobium leguminosarum]